MWLDFLTLLTNTMGLRRDSWHPPESEAIVRDWLSDLSIDGSQDLGGAYPQNPGLRKPGGVSTPTAVIALPKNAATP
jgi:hypothetical protein